MAQLVAEEMRFESGWNSTSTTAMAMGGSRDVCNTREVYGGSDKL